MECVGSLQNVFSQVSWGRLPSLGFLLWTSLRVSVKSEEKGVYGFLLQDVAAQLRVAGPISAVLWGHLQCEWVLLGEHSVGSILLGSPGAAISASSSAWSWTWSRCFPALSHLKLPHKLLGSHTALVSQPLSHQKMELGGNRKDHPLGGPHSEKDSQKSHSPRAALVPPCPSGQYIRQIICQGTSHGTGSAQERRHPQDLRSAHRGFPSVVPALWSCALSPCGYLPFMQLSFGGVWGITCSEPDSQPTKSDWFWIRPHTGFVLYFITQEHKRVESGYLLNN